MKRTVSVIISIVFTGVFAASAFGQATKIGWIDTGAFGDEKEGVTKYINALKALDNEMKPRVTELQTIAAKIKTISDDLQKMQSNPAIPVDQKVALQKQDEGNSLQRQYDFKKKEYDAALETRSGAVLGPVSDEIGKAIQDFAKQKGYVAILDINALAQANAILALDSTANVTKEFIAYFNTRPAATTASSATPNKP
ncbi:MAG: OmpH family outer membrane protein [Acidobacteria bacterium]|nr:OmpH family outer membrane protein [Acidobacteriota bacterium]